MLRVIDTNLNRVCEGFRVIEDILRFKYNSELFSKQIKDLRHKVRTNFYGFENDLLDFRDVSTDIGPKISKELNLVKKQTVISLICSNFKRVQEGLRSLEEVSKTKEPIKISTTFEEIRYISYKLEKEIIGFVARQNFALPDIYGITYLKMSQNRSNIEVVKEMINAGIKLIQYREKDLSILEKYKECLEIRKLTRDSGVFFIINDNIDLAIICDADGVHIGQDDLPISEVRNLIGSNKIIGISTHCREQGQKAVLDGADYIGVGPIFETKTKINVCKPVGLEYLNWVRDNIPIPYVTIGGIKEHNLKQILDNGATSVALVSEITNSIDITSKIKEINKIIKDNRDEI